MSPNQTKTSKNHLHIQPPFCGTVCQLQSVNLITLMYLRQLLTTTFLICQTFKEVYDSVFY